MNIFKKFILIVFDLIIALFSLWLALLIRYQLLNQVNYDYFEHALVFGPVFLLWLIVYFINDLYDYYKFSDLQNLLYSTLRSALFIFVVTVVFFYIIPKLQITPKTILVLIVIISSGLQFVWRYVFNIIFGSDRLLKRIMIIGNDKIETSVAERIKNNHAFGFKLAGLVIVNPGRRVKLKSLGKIADLEKIIRKRNIDTIALDVNAFRLNDEVFKIVSDVCISRHIEVVDINYLYEQLTGKVPLDNISQVWFTNFNQSANKFSIFVKRFLDIVLSMLGLMAFIILFPLLYILIKLDSKGNFFYTDERTGLNNRLFGMYKIRTMTQAVCDDKNSKWVKGNDNRVTYIGQILRRTGLDELPQSWNILKGEMSIVGPRPERPMYIEKLDKRQKLYYKRHLVKPGLTGWAQVMAPYGASFSDADEKLEYDLYYIKNRSIFLDLLIILKTVKRIFENRN